VSVFSHPEFDHHEQLIFAHDAASGLRAIIAVHSTRLGPSLGGCRMYPYASDADALTDALRLSRGMTYKAALAGLPQGGGKSVIIGDPRADKTPALFRAMGEAVERLGGAYIVAEDSGISVPDVRLMAQHTRHVGGLADPASGRSGDPSPATAYGVLVALRAAVRQRLGRENLEGLHVAVQGVGAVGFRLAGLLHRAGARLTVCDVHTASAQRAAEAYGATVVSPGEIHAVDAEVFAPCALGAILNDETIPQLRAKVVAGAANNQLAAPRHDEHLRKAGILYAPDYVANAGGIIDIHYEGPDYDAQRVRAHLDRIGDTLATVFARAEAEGIGTGAAADAMVRALLSRE
jgi:leucine dehydrogenase